MEYLAGRLGISPGQTTPDGRVGLRFAECLGVCEFAPAVLVNETLHKNMTREKIDELLAAMTAEKVTPEGEVIGGMPPRRSRGAFHEKQLLNSDIRTRTAGEHRQA